MGAARPAYLIGPASVDRYLSPPAPSSRPSATSVESERPGGGAVNMAYHWARRQIRFELVTRVAAHDAAWFEAFFAHNGIVTTQEWIADGDTCAVDVVIGGDRQPWMDNFVEGIWADFEPSDREVAAINASALTHCVLADVVDAALLRLAAQGRVAPDAHLTGDFLSFRHFTIDRFAATFRLLDVGFIGWPGAPDDPIVGELGDYAFEYGNVLVVTFGAHGIRVFDGRGTVRERRDVPIDARPVEGSTVGCGDAFIAAFLAEWISGQAIDVAVEAGKRLGAAATSWSCALPDGAYAGIASTRERRSE